MGGVKIARGVMERTLARRDEPNFGETVEKGADSWEVPGHGRL